MKAVVMAGGEGSRLRPITAGRPKPLVPVAGTPIMEHILLHLKKFGITEVVTTLHYLADEIQSYFDDGSDLGLDLKYSIEDTPLGTAGSVKKAEEHLRDGTFVIVSGDALTDVDLDKALKFHREKGSLATLILYRVANPLEFGVVITDEDGRINRFLEKPSWSEVFSDTVNTGMYILEPEIFDLMEQGKQYDWSSDIFPQLLRDGKPMFGYIMEEYWCDVGTLNQYREAQHDLLDHRTQLTIQADECRSSVWQGANAQIDAAAHILPPVYIGRNTKVKAGARVGPFAVLGDNCIVEEGAIVDRSVVWDGTYLGPGVTLHSAIVGSRCTIKKDTQIQEEAVIGDRCLIDIGCTIRPRIKLWPDKVIERGSTVTMSLVWGSKWRGNLFRELGVAGLSNIEMTPEYASRLGAAFGSIFANGSMVVTCRDSTRSSRMLKRAMMASLLSVGCEVVDLRGTAVPIARHFIKTSGAVGAMNVRKLPGNRRVSLFELFDGRGAYLAKNQERKVETAFFREDFHRIDPEDLGSIHYAGHAIEEYEEAYHTLLGTRDGRHFRIVCDFGFSSIGSLMPALLGSLGVEIISINSYNDAKLAPRSDEEVAKHIGNLKNIVSTLGYDFGVLFTNEGERLHLVDQAGRVLGGNDLLAVMASLTARTVPGAEVCLSMTASNRVEEMIRGLGGKVTRSKSDVRSIMDTATKRGVAFAGDQLGGFIFPKFHPGFDAMFALGKLISMLRANNIGLNDVTADLPSITLAYEQVRCPWEVKGTVMRRLAEEFMHDEEVELIDGIKIHQGDAWVLVLPDSFEQVFHVYAEAPDTEESQRQVEAFRDRIIAMQS